MPSFKDIIIFPAMFISGQVFLNQTIGNSGARQIGVQEFDIVNMIKSSTKYAVIIKKPEEIKYHLEKAYHICTKERPGPVWIDIPANIQNAKIDPKKLINYKSRNKTKKNSILDNKIKKIAKLFLKYNNPYYLYFHLLSKEIVAAACTTASTPSSKCSQNMASPNSASTHSISSLISSTKSKDDCSLLVALT